jgi:hypothetical protein
MKNLLILPSTMGLVAITWVLSSWKPERSSQASCFKLFDHYYSGVLQDFQNKTQRFLCMTLSSLSFVVFLDPLQGIYDVCLFSPLKICGICGSIVTLCLLSLTLLLIGLCGAYWWGDSETYIA